MNRYELSNAVRSIEGYDLRVRPGRRRQDEFADAKAECVRHLRSHLERVESLTFDQYVAERRERSQQSAQGEKGSTA